MPSVLTLLGVGTVPAASGGGGGGTVALDVVTDHGSGNSDSSGNFSWTHTPVGTPTDVVVYLFTSLDDNVLETTSCTYGGTSMTLLAQLSQGNYTINVLVFGLVNPASGAQTVACSFPYESDFVAVSTTFTGGDTSGTLTSHTSTGTSTSVSDTISSAVGDMVINGGVWANTSAGTAGGSQTQEWQENDVYGAVFRAAGSIADGASSVTSTWSITSANWLSISVNIPAAP